MIASDDKRVTDNRETIKYLDKHLNKSLLRFIACGSVDDGKSTLNFGAEYFPLTFFSA